MSIPEKTRKSAQDMRMLLDPRTIDGKTRLHGMIWATLTVFLISVVMIFEWIVNFAGYSYYTRLLATFVTILSCLPWIRYCALARFKDYPFFEFHCLFNALCYGYAGFRPTVLRAALTEEMTQNGLLASLLAVIGSYFGYYVLGRLLGAGIRPFRTGIQDSTWSCVLGLGWSVFVISLIFAFQFVGISAMNQLYKFVLFFAVTLWGTWCFSGMAKKIWRFIFIGALSIPIGMAFLAEGSIGYILGASTPICVIYMWSNKRIIMWPLIVIFAFIILFQPIKNTYRSIVLHEGMSRDEQFQVFKELLKVQHEAGQSAREQFERSFLRMNHLMSLSMVMRDTPSVEPYEKGATYWPIFVKWIPRVLWPNKPLEDIGNRWARRYGYIDQNDYITSFNLPWFAEYYMNFGWSGMILIPIVIGIIFRLITIKFGVNRLTIYDFSFGYPVLMAIGGGESNFSMVFGGLIVGGICMAILILPFIIWLRRNQYVRLAK
jgi:hypothetical protein